MARCEARLARDYPEAYRAFLAGWRRIVAAGGEVPGATPAVYA